jgi:septal ring factor EnvC (AmiA/AmiB activator)
MSETDPTTEPHVSTDELRAALAPRREPRRNPVLVSEHSEHADREAAELRSALEAAREGESGLRTELNASRRAIDSARADAIELRAALDASRGDAAELRAELSAARIDLRERKTALDRLANAGLFRRRKVLNDLATRGLI